MNWTGLLYPLAMALIASGFFLVGRAQGRSERSLVTEPANINLTFAGLGLAVLAIVCALIASKLQLG